MSTSTTQTPKTSLLRKTMETAKSHPVTTGLIALGAGAAITAATFVSDISLNSALLRTPAHMARQVEISNIRAQNAELIAKKKPLLDALQAIDAQNYTYARQIESLERQDQLSDAKRLTEIGTMFIGMMIAFYGGTKLFEATVNRISKRFRKEESTETC